MRPTQKPNRPRGRGSRKPGTGGGTNLNRVFDSSGPEGKVRGTPQQIYDKYLTLARDAQTAGDRVTAENFLQHAEHYQRLLSEGQPDRRDQYDQDGEGDEGGDYDSRVQPREGQQREAQQREGQQREGQQRNGQRDGQQRDGQSGREAGNRDTQGRDGEGREDTRGDRNRDDRGRDGGNRDRAARDGDGRDDREARAPRDGDRRDDGYTRAPRPEAVVSGMTTIDARDEPSETLLVAEPETTASLPTPRRRRARTAEPRKPAEAGGDEVAAPPTRRKAAAAPAPEPQATPQPESGADPQAAAQPRKAEATEGSEYRAAESSEAPVDNG